MINKFYYIVENGSRETVVADGTFINGLKQQYYYRESDGNLTKVIGDTSWTKNVNTPTGGSPNPNDRKVNKKQVSENIKKQIAKSKENKKETAKKSKENKKTIESF